MKSIRQIACCLAASMFLLGVWAKHYSFVGGYPANGITTERAKSVENGGTSVQSKVAGKTASRAVVAENSLTGRVTKVSDGDTIWVVAQAGSTEVKPDSVTQTFTVEDE